ncbi:MAG: hypothetical protein ACYDDG_16605, partial [Casimicrobiaceae bacterium]
RNDPLSFVMRSTRAYNPEVWRTLESLSFGRLVVQAARERKFAIIYRGSDAAHRLSDEDFAGACPRLRGRATPRFAVRRRPPSSACVP